MANGSFRVKKSLNVEPKSTSQVAEAGDVGYNSSSAKFEVYGASADNVVQEALAQPLTNKTLDASLNTLSNIVNSNISASAAIAYSKLNLASSIVNADVSGSAAIAYSKLNLSTSIVNADVNASAAIAYSKLNLATSIVNADINASAAIDYSKLNLALAIVNGDISASAAIAYSKLNLASSIVNADISGSAAIAYSKLNLATSIVNADVAVAAAIARSKLASGTADHVLINDGSGVMSSEANLAVSRGGTGAGSFTANRVLLGNGTSAFQTVAPGTTGNVLTSDGSTWVSATPTAGSAQSSSQEISNLSISASVGSNALTIALKDQAGSDPSVGSPVKIGFRNSTLTNGSYNQRSVTSALSVVVSSGSTLGTTSGASDDVYVYAIDNAGTVELAVSHGLVIDEGLLVSTTAEGGAGAADSGSVLYSTTARTNVPVRLIGKVTSSQATAGTWASSPTSISVVPFKKLPPPIYSVRVANGGSASIGSQSGGLWVSSVNRVSSGIVEVNFVSGIFSKEPICTGNVIASATPNRTFVIDSTPSTSQITTQVGIATTGTYNDHGFTLTCQESF